jgi:hypothetical protein
MNGLDFWNDAVTILDRVASEFGGSVVTQGDMQAQVVGTLELELGTVRTNGDVEIVVGFYAGDPANRSKDRMKFDVQLKFPKLEFPVVGEPELTVNEDIHTWFYKQMVSNLETILNIRNNSFFIVGYDEAVLASGSIYGNWSCDYPDRSMMLSVSNDMIMVIQDISDTVQVAIDQYVEAYGGMGK